MKKINPFKLKVLIRGAVYLEENICFSNIGYIFSSVTGEKKIFTRMYIRKDKKLISSFSSIV